MHSQGRIWVCIQGAISVCARTTNQREAVRVSPDPLSKYHEKRDFGKTPEPRGEHAGSDTGRAFVVHRHDATNLHYDLRLEMDGVLVSFAIPKGLSHRPEDKRLAVHTEDHPMQYLTFHGVIPKGQYGAGTMTIWDRGTYEIVNLDGDGRAGLEAGKLEFNLWGGRFRGQWHMVRTTRSPKDWLIFKSRDVYARGKDEPHFPLDLSSIPRKPWPKSMRPLASVDGDAFSDPEWLFEMEFCGRRLFLEKNDDEIRFRSLRKDPLSYLDALRREGKKLRGTKVLLDGVLVALDAGGRPDADLLQQRLAEGSAEGVVYYAFDLLYFDEWDLRDVPLMERKNALRTVIPPGAKSLLYVDHVIDRGEAFAHVVRTAGLPGMIAKWSSGKYRNPKNEPRWLRVAVDDDAEQDQNVYEALSSLKERTPGSRGLRHAIKFTNMNKVLWPEAGFTKGDLVDYYDAVSETIVRYLENRPMHMNRFPDGIDGKQFYQKNAPDHVPDWVRKVPIQSENREIHYVVCDDRETLLYLANLASIDLHPWFSRVGTLDSPDWAIIDLDPDGSPFKDVVRLARTTGKILSTIGLRSCAKTSGATGIHIYIPLQPGYTYEHARMFCEGVARLVVREHPDIATVERVVAQRSGKVYVDFLQNRRGQTIVPAYCARPQPGATVSAPLDWDEVNSDLHPSQFTIMNMPDRLRRLGDLFEPALKDKQNLLEAIEALHKWFEN